MCCYDVKGISIFDLPVFASSEQTYGEDHKTLNFESAQTSER